jgi:hypothetical protein
MIAAAATLGSVSRRRDRVRTRALAGEPTGVGTGTPVGVSASLTVDGGGAAIAGRALGAVVGPIVGATGLMAVAAE